MCIDGHPLFYFRNNIFANYSFFLLFIIPLRALGENYN